MKKNEGNFAIDFSVFFHFHGETKGRRNEEIFLFSMLEHKVGKEEKKGKRKSLI